MEWLLRQHPELRAEAEGFAVALLDVVHRDQVAAGIEAALGSLGFEALNARASRQGRGYVEPTDAAWHILTEALAPFEKDLERRLALGLEAAARATAEGMLLGLYSVRDARAGSLLEWACDFAEGAAAQVLQRLAAAQPPVLLSPDFGAEIPTWNHMLAPTRPARAASKGKGARRG